MGAGAGFPRPFGPYTLLCELGRGGMGETYLARSRGLQGIAKPCVIKTARPDAREADRVKRRFLDELRVAVLLKSPSICPVFDVGEVEGTPFVAMEYISRLNLRQVQDRAQASATAFPEDVAIWICTRVLEGLQHAHTLPDARTNEPLGIIHRDVSPHNVMVGLDGNVWLIDFGLARVRHKTEQTESGAMMGKLLYMAPEQVRGEEIGPTVDQFATAVMLYELVAGERFYEGVAQHEVTVTAGRGGFRPRRWSALSPALEEVLTIALSAAPGDRFDSCRSFGRALLDATRAAPDASRFAQLLEGLFPGAEEEERQFFTSLPEPSEAPPRPAVAEVTAIVSRRPPAPRASEGEDGRAAANHTSTDVLARQWRPKRSRYVLAALSACALGLVIVAAVSWLREPAPAAVPLTTNATNETNEANETNTAAAKAPDGPADATLPSPARTDPVLDPRADSTPSEVELEEAASDVAKAPSAAERPERTEPIKAVAAVVPKTTRPVTRVERPQASASKAEPSGPLASTLAALQRCEEGCAKFWLNRLREADALNDDVRYGVEVCLARCDR